MSKHLIFVYNADSGLFNTVTDIAHKILSPSTYNCNLCAITHSYFSVRENWANFVKELPLKCEFLHRDEFIRKYNRQDSKLPAIFQLEQDMTIKEVIAADQINKCKTIDELKQLITTLI